MPKSLLSMPTSTERAGIAKSIGQRLKDARELADFSQIEAARLLGYKNSSKLAKIEGATGPRSVPHWVIKRAAELYDVSIDYLYGISDDWELSARACMERDVSKWVFNVWEAARRRDMEVMRRLQNRVDFIRDSIGLMGASSDELRSALERFIELNPEFEDEMRGGSRLVAAVKKVEDVTGNAKCKLKKLKEECRAVESSPSSVGALDL